MMRLLFSPKTIIGMAAGFVLAHFLDPDRGRSRRAKARDQLMAKARRTGRDAAGEAEYLAGKAKGAVVDLTSSPEPLEDKALADRVASEVMRDSRWKGSVNLEAAGRTVVIRGEVQRAEWMEELERRVSEVSGVEDVESYLHLPGQIAPNVARSVRVST